MNFNIAHYFICSRFYLFTLCFISNPPADFDGGTDDDEQNGNDVMIKNETNQPVQPNENAIPSENEIEILTNQIEDNTNEISKSVPPADIVLVTAQTENRIDLSEICDLNNGGCEQTCNMVDGETNSTDVVECSCKSGFYLDDDGKKCLGESIISYLAHACVIWHNQPTHCISTYTRNSRRF